MCLVRRLLLALSLTLGLGTAHALDIQPYSADALSAAQQAGQPVALHFHADWCPTCRAQTKVFQQFSADKVLDMTLFVVNYDKERELKRQLGVRTQSTLIVYRGAKETARLAGDTDADALRAALQSAL